MHAPRLLTHLRAGNLHRAAWSGRNRESKAVQFDYRSNQAQSQTEPFGTPAFVRSIEAFGHCLAFELGDSRAGVFHLDYGFDFPPNYCEVHTPTRGGEFHRVVDKIGDSLEKKIAISVHDCVLCGIDPKDDVLVL